jgi:large repetitive protein
MKRILALGVFGVAFAAAAAAAAQDNGFGAQNFQVAPGYGSFLTVEGSAVPPGLGGGVGGLLSYQYKPLVLHGCDAVEDGMCTDWADDEGTALVKHHLSIDVYGSLSLFRILELGVAVPAVLYQEGEDGPAGTGVQGPSGKVGLGDVRAHVKWDLMHTFGYAGEFVGLALVPVVTFPTANAIDSESFMGDSSVTVHPKLAFGLNFSRVRLGLNVGYLWRKTSDFTPVTEVGPRLSYGAAVEVLFNDRVSGIVELFGQNGFVPDVSQSPLEGDLAARIKTDSGIAVTVGGGAGIIAGVGTPVVRAFAGLAWMKPLESDKDYDGILDKEDKCPEDPEDKDRFEDEDGCPDPDNDGDGVLDVDDGCPDDPEDKDSFEDENGCPDPDNDGDGILDADDKCPNEAEDKDAFEDENGCPDPDNDRDGILDADDKCPNEAETKNEYQDEDGCPDEKPVEPPKLAEVKEDQIVIMEQIHFETAKAIIKGESFGILDAVTKVLEENPTIKIRIEGHTDSRGKAGYNRKLSNKRAKAVMKYLTDKGIDAGRMTAEGFGPDKPIEDNDTEEGRAKNRRVEFHITER